LPEAIAASITGLHIAPQLRELFVFLLSAVLVVPVFRRLKTSPVLGYLLVGVIIGPFGLKAISDVEGARQLGEFGVIFLLFSIGLDLSLERLASMKRLIFGLGGAQVTITGLIIGLIALAWGNTPAAAIIIGISLALSSTAIITQLLIENEEFSSNFGRSVFSVLLFQDLAVVPLLVMVNALSTGAEPLSIDLLYSIGQSLAAVLIIIVIGRQTLRPLFRMVAAAHLPELLMAMTLLVILATAIGTELAGLSMALGAFLAGMLVAETEFRHQVEVDIQPFKGLLLGLFFIGVGMGIDVSAVLDKAFLVGLSVIGLIGIKAVIFGGIGHLFGLSRPIILRGALLLGPGGEFALLVIGVASVTGLLAPGTGQFMMIVTAISMALTPLLQTLGLWLERKIIISEEASQSKPALDDARDLRGHVIIAGFGRVGQTVASLLTAQKVPYLALDIDPIATKAQRAAGMPIFYGDAERDEVLEQLGISRAAALVLTLNEPLKTKKILSAIRAQWPHIPVYVRARDISDSRQLEILGATVVVPEALEASLALAGEVLHGIGTPLDAVNILLDRIRDENYAGLEAIGKMNKKIPDV
jgi:monovalent cation:H+ antiporter-2, CPA2 family